MSVSVYVREPPDESLRPFGSAEEAWLWYGTAVLARTDFRGPCHPDEIAVAFYASSLNVFESFALIRAGLYGGPPSIDEDGPFALAAYHSGLRKLGKALERMGLVVQPVS